MTKLEQRVLSLAQLGYVPAAIEAVIGYDVRNTLTKLRRVGFDIPHHSPRPISPVMPRSNAPLFREGAADAVENTIQALAADGVSQRKIAAQLGVSLGYVQRVLTRARAAA